MKKFLLLLIYVKRVLLVFFCDPDDKYLAGCLLNDYKKHRIPLDFYVYPSFVVDKRISQFKVEGDIKPTFFFVKFLWKWIDISSMSINHRDGDVSFWESFGLRCWYDDSGRMHVEDDYQGEEKQKALAAELVELLKCYQGFSCWHYPLRNKENATCDDEFSLFKSLKQICETDVVYMRRRWNGKDVLPVQTCFLLQELKKQGYRLIKGQKYLEIVET